MLLSNNSTLRANIFEYSVYRPFSVKFAYSYIYFKLLLYQSLLFKMMSKSQSKECVKYYDV